ncbi:cytochrome P450 [Gordonia sp. C13]|uniref:cytochrome P450 n=1 Tax=Gordonia sp. C13 TaxID=2935078 RepID=UPI00200AD944|nr:cytochrome P450 [Gordonia sp. C13]MCK8615491.1 cytochrome P450 [Gordonia sp. C13]
MHDLDDPYTELLALTRTAPVSRIGDSTFYLVTGWDAIAEAVARPEEFSSNLTATMVWKEDGKVEEYPIAELGSPIHVLATADDPIHRNHRAMVMPSLVAKRIRALEPFIAATLERLWSDGLRDDGAMDDPGENVMGDLARLVDQGDLDQGTAVMIGLQLVAAGAESTVSLLGSAVYLLGRHPRVVDELRRDRELVPLFVEESLRLESPFRGHYRHVVTDTVLADVDLPAGSHLYLMWGAANRDPETFDRPERIDPDPVNRRSHMAFGKGIHLCVGAALARLEGRLAVVHLLDHTPGGFTVDTADPQWERSLLVRRLRTLPVQVSA